MATIDDILRPETKERKRTQTNTSGANVGQQNSDKSPAQTTNNNVPLPGKDLSEQIKIEQPSEAIDFTKNKGQAPIYSESTNNNVPLPGRQLSDKIKLPDEPIMTPPKRVHTENKVPLPGTDLSEKIKLPNKPIEFTKGADGSELENQSEAQKVVYDFPGMVRKLYENTELSEEQKNELRKKKRRQQIMSAIGDGIASLSNLVFTTKGALDSYDPTKSMTEKTKARWDKFEDEYKNRQDKYKEAAIRAAIEQADQNLQLQKEENDIQKADKDRAARAEQGKMNREAANERQKSQQEFTAGQNDKKIQAQKEIAKGNNATSRANAQTRADSLGNNSNKNVWTIGDIRMPNSSNNPSEIARLFNLLPEDVRQKFMEPEIDKLTNLPIEGKFKLPTTEKMKNAIGKYSEYPALHEELLRISGSGQSSSTSGKKKKGLPETKKKALPKPGMVETHNNQGY